MASEEEKSLWEQLEEKSLWEQNRLVSSANKIISNTSETFPKSLKIKKSPYGSSWKKSPYGSRID